MWHMTLVFDIQLYLGHTSIINGSLSLQDEEYFQFWWENFNGGKKKYTSKPQRFFSFKPLCSMHFQQSSFSCQISWLVRPMAFWEFYTWPCFIHDHVWYSLKYMSVRQETFVSQETIFLPKGKLTLYWSQTTIQSIWNKWQQFGIILGFSSSWSSFKQTEHFFFQK